MRLLGDAKVKKKGQDRNPAPFLNPISYEKPKCIRQGTCRKVRGGASKAKNLFKALIFNIL
jgi:hypothetical protein